jgi:F-type H+-transporting ATPase subunit b
MYLFNQTIDSFSGQVADLAIGLNLDIFETNIVNLLLLGGGIFYLGSQALTESLTDRQEKILSTIQDSEERLKAAIQRLEESEKQLTQSQIAITSLKSEAEATAKQVKSAILADGKNEIERLSSTAKSNIATIEAKVRKQISEYVVTLALQRVTLQLEGKLGANLQQQIIDQNISKL